MKIERQSKKDMKKNIFSIKFYYRPEIYYEDWILKVYVMIEIFVNLQLMAE